MKTIILASAILTFSAPTAKNIMKLNPVLDGFYVKYLTASINNHAKSNDIDPELLTVILFQESSFIPNPRQCDVKPCTLDIGIGQINYRIWKDYFKLDKKRLIHDVDYNVSITAKIIADYKKRYSKRDPHWACRYHSGTPHLKHRYCEKIKRHLDVLNENK